MRFTVLILFVFLSFSANAYYEFDGKIQESYTALLNLKFDDAAQILSKERTEKPGNDLVFLFENYADFLKAFISEEDAAAQQLKKNTAMRLKALTKKTENESSPFHLYAQAEMIIQQAFVKVKMREYVSAATDVRKAYKLIDRNASLYPSFPLNQKLIGLLHVIIGSVPREYHWLVELAGMEGTVNEGTTELKNLFKSISSTPYGCYRPEILFYLSNVYTTFHAAGDLELMETMLMAQSYSTTSPLMRYSTASLLMKLGKNDDAILVMDNPSSYMSAYPFYFMYYKLGMAKLRKMDLSAKEDFEMYIKHFKGQNYIKSAWQKIAWIEKLKGNVTGYFSAMQHCKTAGTAFIDEDKEALNEANANEAGNSILLRSRLLFDGGYYDRAQNELAGLPIDSFPRYRDQLEVTYRLARISQKLEQKDRAIDFYQKTIKNGSSSRSYFAANSALMLGIMFEDYGENERAKDYYTQCLAMGPHEYQNSIDQKAQAGLDRIREKEEQEGE